MTKAFQPARRRALALTGAAIAAGALGRVGIASAQSNALPAKIQMGTFPVNTVLMSFHLGANIWRDQGLNMEFTKFIGGPEMVNALASGSIPAAEIGVGPALLAALRGAPLVYFTLGSVSGKNYPFTRIMVNKDSNIWTFTDLEGKTLALHQRGTMEHLTLGAAAVKFGVPTSKLNISLVPAPNQPQVLAQKQVDAIYALPPFDLIAEKQFGARTLVETIDFIPYLGYTTLALHRNFVKEYPKAVHRLLKGWILFSRWVDDHTKGARQASNQFIGIKGDVADDIRIPFYTRNGPTVLPNVWHVYYMFLAAKTIEPSPEIAKIIDDYFVQPTIEYTLKALDEVGRQNDPVVKDFLNSRLPLLPEPNANYFAPWERDLAKG